MKKCKNCVAHHNNEKESFCEFLGISIEASSTKEPPCVKK